MISVKLILLYVNLSADIIDNKTSLPFGIKRVNNGWSSNYLPTALPVLWCMYTGFTLYNGTVCRHGKVSCTHKINVNSI